MTSLSCTRTGSSRLNPIRFLKEVRTSKNQPRNGSTYVTIKRTSKTRLQQKYMPAGNPKAVNLANDDDSSSETHETPASNLVLGVNLSKPAGYNPLRTHRRYDSNLHIRKVGDK